MPHASTKGSGLGDAEGERRGNTPNPPYLHYIAVLPATQENFEIISQVFSALFCAKTPGFSPRAAVISTQRNLYKYGSRPADPTARNFAGHAPKRRLYSHPLKRTPVEPGSSGSAPARQWSEKTLGNSVMVAQLTLDQLVKVRILIPQLALFVDDS